MNLKTTRNKLILINLIIFLSVFQAVKSSSQWKRAKRLTTSNKKIKGWGEKISSIDSVERSLQESSMKRRKSKTFKCYKHCNANCSKFDEMSCRKLCEKTGKLNFFRRSTFVGKSLIIQFLKEFVLTGSA